MTTKPTILMLGWEFPPQISGGLGIANYNICKGLSKWVHQLIVLPNLPEGLEIENARITGISNVHSIRKHTKKWKQTLSNNPILSSVDFFIDPYKTQELKTETIKHKGSNRKAKKFHNPLDAAQLYDNHTIQRVVEYTKQVVDLCEHWKFDVIHCHDWMTMLAGVELKKRTNKPLVIHVHSLEYDRFGMSDNNWVIDVEKYGLEQADCIIPVSKYTGKVAEEQYATLHNKIKPIYNGVYQINNYKKAKSFPEKLVVFIGRITPQKGPENFLAIAEKVYQEYPNVRFVMAGTGELLEPIIENSAYKHLGTRFHFTGFLNREQINELLAQADVYCMPSKSEPFGLSAVEAVQFKVPCVLSKQSGVSEIIQGALKADYWDVDKMAKHICMLLKDDKFAKTVADNAYIELQNYSWDVTALQINNIYQSLLK
jgi:glycogen(starch) synthase